MSDTQPSNVVPTFIFAAFVVVVGVGAFLSGAPKAPSMPGVRVPDAPKIEARRQEVEAAKEGGDEVASKSPEGKPSASSQNKESSKETVPEANDKKASGAPAAPSGGANQWQ